MGWDFACASPGISAHGGSATRSSIGLGTSVSRGHVRLRFPVVETLAYQFGWIPGSSRRLSGPQQALARTIFEESLDLDAVRIVLTAFTPDRQVTLGNYIRTRGSIPDATLIHELTHVWQFQNGGAAYISDSAVRQICDPDGAYDLTGVVTAHKTFSQYTAEQQAMIVQTFFEEPAKREDPIYKKLLAEVRAQRPLPRTERFLRTYEEGLFGPSQPDRFLAPQRPGDESPTIMPLFRLEF